jgi:hypothetical protein
MMCSPATIAPSETTHDGVVRRVGVAVLGQQLAETIQFEGHLGDQRAVRVGEVTGGKRRHAAIAAEHLDDQEALMAARGRAQAVDHLDGTGHAGGKADAVVGAEDVVVHRLRNAHGRRAFLVQPAA